MATKIVPPFVRNPYNYDTYDASHSSGLACLDPSLAVQAEKDDSDINVIVKRFGLTGTVPQGYRAPSFGDFTGVSDYQSALNALISAEDAFYELPAEIRSRFENDPQKLIEFVENDSNRAEAISLGIVSPPPSPPVDASAASAAPPKEA